MFTLYYSPGACSLASHIVLHELGQLPKLVKVDLKTKQTDSAEDFKAINPKGYVPTLRLANGEILTENIAILQYLGSIEPGLLPHTGMAKWHAIEALAFVSTELHKAFKPLFDPTATDDVKQKTKQQIAQRLGLLVPRLGEREFIVGDAFSVVDAYLFVMLLWSKKQGIEVPAPLASYAENLAQRPAVQAALQAEGLPTAQHEARRASS